MLLFVLRHMTQALNGRLQLSNMDMGGSVRDAILVHEHAQYVPQFPLNLQRADSGPLCRSACGDACIRTTRRTQTAKDHTLGLRDPLRADDDASPWCWVVCAAA
jgi:hypothetical protein